MLKALIFYAGLRYIGNCFIETLISTPLFVQQALPFCNAVIANRFLIAFFAPNISLAASFVNSISKCVKAHFSGSIITPFIFPIFVSSTNRSALTISILLILFHLP